VSVVDDAGNLLSAPADAQAQGADTQKLQYTQQLEQLYTRRIMEMLEPLVGRNNVKAQVSADVDFSMVESTSEEHKPNQSPDTSAVRSQQTVEDGTPGAAQPNGVPGAVTNQPPATGTAPINGAAAPVGVAPQGGTDKPGSMRRESVVNYEVDKTVKVVRESSGQIRRLSAAVVINHRTTTDKAGKETTVAIPAAQLEQMTALVRETIGFNKERGDSVNVVNAVFNVEKTSEVDEIAWWKQGENQELLRGLAWPLGMVGLGLLVLMGMVRPGLKLLKTPVVRRDQTELQPLNAMLNEAPERPGLPMPSNEPTPENQRLVDAKRLALENPMAVANIVKGWVNGESPA
jgi:flagellar M-ring protein FliF